MPLFCITPVWADADADANALPTPQPAPLPILLPAEPVLDTSPPTVGGQPITVDRKKDEPITVDPKFKTPGPTRILNGGVSRTDKRRLLQDMLLGPVGRNAAGGNMTRSGSTATAVNGPARMTTEEYRRLEYGVIGFNAELRFNVSGPVVTTLFPSCPAANAGIKPGDVLVTAGNHTFQSGEGQEVLWRVVGGRAGTPLEMSVMRDGMVLSFSLVRMNIEDIQDVRIRNYYEDLLSRYGAPGDPADAAITTPAKPFGVIR